MYRVRKSWKDSKSQLGAYILLSNAKRMVDKHPGYSAFDERGRQVYPQPPIYAASSGNVVTLNGKRVTVWNQHKRTGRYQSTLDKHGCGICCAAMAATLKGKSVTPEQTMERAQAALGKADKAISTAGLVKVLKKTGVSAKRHDVTSATLYDIRHRIDRALKEGKPVICWTYRADSADPFAGGDHYVLAVGYTDQGKVLIANSGSRGPVQVVSLGTLVTYLRRSTGKDTGWCKSAAGSAGIVIVG